MQVCRGGDEAHNGHIDFIHFDEVMRHFELFSVANQTFRAETYRKSCVPLLFVKSSSDPLAARQLETMNN